MGQDLSYYPKQAVGFEVLLQQWQGNGTGQELVHELLCGRPSAWVQPWALPRGVTATDARGFLKDAVLQVLEEPAAVRNGSDFYYLHKVGD